jgi:hypothetical protein
LARYRFGKKNGFFPAAFAALLLNNNSSSKLRKSRDA